MATTIQTGKKFLMVSVQKNNNETDVVPSTNSRQLRSRFCFAYCLRVFPVCTRCRWFRCNRLRVSPRTKSKNRSLAISRTNSRASGRWYRWSCSRVIRTNGLLRPNNRLPVQSTSHQMSFVSMTFECMDFPGTTRIEDDGMRPLYNSVGRDDDELHLRIVYTFRLTVFQSLFLEYLDNITVWI